MLGQELVQDRIREIERIAARYHVLGRTRREGRVRSLRRLLLILR